MSQNLYQKILQEICFVESINSKGFSYQIVVLICAGLFKREDVNAFPTHFELMSFKGVLSVLFSIPKSRIHLGFLYVYVSMIQTQCANTPSCYIALGGRMSSCTRREIAPRTLVECNTQSYLTNPKKSISRGKNQLQRIPSTAVHTALCYKTTYAFTLNISSPHQFNLMVEKNAVQLMDLTTQQSFNYLKYFLE